MVHESVSMASTKLRVYFSHQICHTDIGENLQSKVEWRRSTYGIKIGGVSMKSRTWQVKKSELHRDSSMIFTMNSRAGCDMA